MNSKIDLTEQVENKDRKFGSTTHYFPAKTEDGQPLLFTENQINEALHRAKSNPEDMPAENSNLFDWLFS